MKAGSRPNPALHPHQEPLRLKPLFLGLCLMITLSSNSSVLPFNYANNGLGSNWALVFQDAFSGTNLNHTNWVPYWFSDGTINPGSSTYGYASNVVVNGQLNLILRNSTNGALIRRKSSGSAGGLPKFDSSGSRL
jgi:hypothetical protein